MTHKTIPLALALSITFTAVLADTVTWDGNGNPHASGNWSVGANWSGDTVPVAADTAVLPDVTSGTRTTSVDSAFAGTLVSLRLVQTTAGAVNALSLGRSLTLSANTTALQYNTASGVGSLAAAALFDVSLGGYDLVFSYNASGANATLLGTWRLDAANSRVYSSRQQGTGGSDTVNVYLGSSGSPAEVRVAATGFVGHIQTVGTQNGTQPTYVTVAAGSSLSVGNNATLTIVKQVRGTTSTIQLSNAGAVAVDAGSTLTVKRHNVGSTTGGRTVFLNQAGGALLLKGTLGADYARGSSAGGTVTHAVNNLGTWVVSGPAARLKRTSTDASSYTVGSGGALRGDTASDALDYDEATATPAARQLVEVTGPLAPGAGTAGAAFASVGTLALRDIDLSITNSTGTLELDIGGTSPGQYDRLVLEAGGLAAGTLLLDATGASLAIHYVNGFTPTAGYGLPILGYGTVAGSFDLGSRLSISGATGRAADPANYSIDYGGTQAVLRFHGSPGSVVLLR